MTIHAMSSKQVGHARHNTVRVAQRACVKGLTRTILRLYAVICHMINCLHNCNLYLFTKLDFRATKVCCERSCCRSVPDGKPSYL